VLSSSSRYESSSKTFSDFSDSSLIRTSESVSFMKEGEFSSVVTCFVGIGGDFSSGRSSVSRFFQGDYYYVCV